MAKTTTHENLSQALRSALDAYPEEVTPDVETLIRQRADLLDERRHLRDEDALEDALLKSDGMPIDRSVPPELAYLRKMSPSAAAALEARSAV